MFTVHPCQLESPAEQSFLAEGVRHMSGSPPAARYKQAYPELLACILTHGGLVNTFYPIPGIKKRVFMNLRSGYETVVTVTKMIEESV